MEMRFQSMGLLEELRMDVNPQIRPCLDQRVLLGSSDDRRVYTIIISMVRVTATPRVHKFLLPPGLLSPFFLQ